MPHFASRLREARIAAGLTQEQLGFALDVTKSSVSAWENGREAPGFRLLPRLSAVLGCSLDSLVCGQAVAGPGRVAEQPDPRQAQSRDEELLLRRYRATSKARRQAVLTLLAPSPGHEVAYE